MLIFEKNVFMPLFTWIRWSLIRLFLLVLYNNRTKYKKPQEKKLEILEINKKKILIHKKYVFIPLTCRNSFSNLNAPPPVAQTVVTNSAMPFCLANSRKLLMSVVWKRMKCSEPRRLRISTLSIWKVKEKYNKNIIKTKNV